jgi:hypothetical protein
VVSEERSTALNRGGALSRCEQCLDHQRFALFVQSSCRKQALDLSQHIERAKRVSTPQGSSRPEHHRAFRAQRGNAFRDCSIGLRG